jgi:Bbp16-like protein
MILDGLLVFTGASGTGDLPTVGTQASSNVLDLGISGLPISTVGGGGGGARDIGIGDDPAMKLLVQVITAFVGGTSLAVAVQGAPDSGTGTPGTYTTMLTGPVVVEASLIAGARILDDDFPRPAPGQALPRFIRLSYITVGTHTAGAIFGTIVLDRHDLPEQSNAVLGGYQAGITVAN